MCQSTLVTFCMAFFLYHQLSVNGAGELNKTSSGLEIRTRSNYSVALVHYVPILQSEEEKKDVCYVHPSNYVKIMEKAKEYDVKMIVFPEMGLYNSTCSNEYNEKFEYLEPYNFKGKPHYTEGGQRIVDSLSDMANEARLFFGKYIEEIPDPENQITPCLNNNTSDERALKMLSCAARRLNMYVVMHTYEKEDCSHYHRECPEDQLNLYSTAVAFDNNGTVIARYRKPDVSNEHWVDIDPRDRDDKTGKPKECKVKRNNRFTSDFNVDFELLIGSELLAEITTKSKAGCAKVDVREKVDVILMTRPRYGDVPLISSVQDHVTWALKFRVNLLVAGLAKGGASGIYMGEKEPTHKFLSTESVNYFIYENITGRPKASTTLSRYTIKNVSASDVILEKKVNPISPLFFGHSLKDFYHASLLQTKNVNVSLEYQVHDICDDDGACCHFALHLKPKESANFTMKLAGLTGFYELVNGTKVAINLCVILACELDEDFSTCAKLPNTAQATDFPCTIESAVISRHFNTTDRLAFLSPTAMTSSGMLVEGHDYNFFVPESSEGSLYLMYLNKPVGDIVMFGMVSQLYTTEESKDDFENIVGPLYTVELVALIVVLIVFGLSVCTYAMHVAYKKQVEVDLHWRRLAKLEQDIELKRIEVPPYREQRKKYRELLLAYNTQSGQAFRDLYIYMMLNNYTMPTITQIVRDAEELKRHTESKSHPQELSTDELSSSDYSSFSKPLKTVTFSSELV